MREISKSSWIFRVAYYFWPRDLPECVDRCMLVSRFLLFLIPVLCIVSAEGILTLVVLGTIGQPAMRMFWFLAKGQRLVYDERRGRRSILLLPLKRVSVLNYRRENIEWLDWCCETPGRRSRRTGPGIVFSKLLLIICFLAVIGAYVWLVVIPVILRGASWLIHSSFTLKVTASAIGAVVLFAVIMLIGAYAVKAWRALVATETGDILLAHVKEFKQKHCAVYRIV